MRPFARRMLLVACLLALSTVAAATPARAGFAEEIRGYTVDLTVSATGGLHVREVIDYDFGAFARHGIYRKIPDTFRYDDKNNRFYPIHNVHVTATGASAKTKTGHERDYFTIRVGDPDHTVTGQHTYTIDYDVDGATEHFDAPFKHSELNWNAIGDEWQVIIETARVTVHGPAKVTGTTCYTGANHSQLQCQRRSSSGKTATFAQTRLFPGSGMTVVVAFPAESVAASGPILKERFAVKRAFAFTPLSGGVGGGLLLLILAGIAWVYWARGRDRRYIGQVPGLEPAKGQVGSDEPRPLFTGAAGAVEFAPPDHIRPGQVGTLLDERANTLDVTATIVDLAVRKYLHITELPQEHWWSGKDWELQRLDPPADDELMAYERQLLDGLFRSGATVHLSDLENTFYTDLSKVENQLYDDVVHNGWFARRPDNVRSQWLGIGLAIFAVGVIGTFFLAKYTHAALIGLPVIVGGIVILAMRGMMPARTAKGGAMLARVLGFRRYLETAEAEQLKFEEKADVFARYLPFAVVFGVTDRWAKAFEALAAKDPNATNALGFYSGPSGWNLGYFAASMSNFTTSTSGTIASHPSGGGGSGGSGFSGGGFSGGGGGGGGGGSW